MKHLQVAFSENYQWWKFFAVMGILFFATQVIGGALLFGLVIVAARQNNPDDFKVTASNLLDFELHGIDPAFGLAILVLPFIIGFIVFGALVKPFHKHQIIKTINGMNRIRIGRFFFGLVLWTILMAFYLGIAYWLEPENYVFQFDPHSFFLLALVAVLTIPFQASFEEVIFRGYLAQYFAAWKKSRWLVIMIPAVLFGLMHSANPEVKEFGFFISMAQYISFGVIFGLISVLDDGIETAMGIHSANNIFLALFVTFKASAIQTPALLVQQEVYPVIELVVLILLGIVAIAILYKKYNWDMSVLRQTIVPEEGAYIADEDRMPSKK